MLYFSTFEWLYSIEIAAAVDDSTGCIPCCYFRNSMDRAPSQQVGEPIVIRYYLRHAYFLSPGTLSSKKVRVAGACCAERLVQGRLIQLQSKHSWELYFEYRAPSTLTGVSDS